MYITLSRANRGFTLIELMVVIAIIGLLASTVLSSLQSARIRGQDAQRISEVRELMKALELYRNTNGGYPCSPTTVTGVASYNCGAAPGANTATTPIIVKNTTVPGATTPAGYFRTAVGFQPSADIATSSIHYHVGVGAAGVANRNGYFIRVNLIDGLNCVVQAGNANRPPAWVGLPLCTTIRAI